MTISWRSYGLFEKRAAKKALKAGIEKDRMIVDPA